MNNGPLPMSLRTAAGEYDYQMAKYKGTTKQLHEESVIKEWKHWLLIDNRFPYTVAFRVHRMLLPRRKVANLTELSLEEFTELLTILAGEINDEYDLWFVNTHKRRSILSHFHIHVATYVLDRKEMSL